jgi:ABC-type multidrug transport system ATPase subunit
VPLTKPEIFDRLTEIHLGDEASRRFSQLSGGQQKRLSLLIATVHNPPLVLLDEPTSGLDPQARRQLWDRIEGIRKSGRSILLTTHSMEEAQSVCDREHVGVVFVLLDQAGRCVDGQDLAVVHDCDALATASQSWTTARS